MAVRHVTSGFGVPSADAARARAQRPLSPSPSQPMTMSGLLQGAPGQSPSPCTPRGRCGHCPFPDRPQQAGAGDGDRATSSGSRPARAAHSPGMGDEVVHGDLDRFPCDDFFECFEDEFIVKGIWRNQC